ncbi:MAG TPA: hypothetical protein VIC08_15255, partial [Cellvibrionaceae bacterium]
MQSNNATNTSSAGFLITRTFKCAFILIFLTSFWFLAINAWANADEFTLKLQRDTISVHDH